MSAWTCRHPDGKTAPKIVPPRPRIPYWNGLGADSEEKREPVSDIDTAVVDSLKVLDLKWPIREADIGASFAGFSARSCGLSLCDNRSGRMPITEFVHAFQGKFASVLR
jgi:hypothetical protein